MMAVVLTGRRLFAFAIFLSATLLFMVQPLAAKILLPVLGGSPAVWSTCLVFFQAVLLIGYLYAHGLSTRVPIRWQRAVHLGVLILAGITTHGTQAAVEYVTKPDYIRDLVKNLNTAPAGGPPKLPISFQVLVRVKVNGGVPVQVSYVTHHKFDQR